jgi:hypothetical protein
MEGANLLRQKNVAFQTSLHMNEAALRVDRSMLMEANPSFSYAALHWRNNGDLMQTKHKLISTDCIIAASRALTAMRATLFISNDIRYVLGDLNVTQLKTIETTGHTVSASLEQPAKFGHHFFQR